MRISIKLGFPLLALFLAAPAAAQRDTLLLGLPVDAVPVPGRGVLARRCESREPVEIVRTPEDAARISAHVWCEEGIEARPDSTLIGVRMRGDCHAGYRLRVARSEAERTYYVVATVVYGGCRAGGGGYFWIAVPAIPPDWKIAFLRRRLDRGDVDTIEKFLVQ
ncbi:MAG TPA: hypothetical protein VFQ45_17195 [Longimicrobium sp.]|nr:hypothetical protein [Longimicrobium sp.]